MNRRHPHSVPCLLVSLLVLPLLLSCRSNEEDATWIFDAGGSDIRDATRARDAPGSNDAPDVSETSDTAPHGASDIAPTDAIAQDTPQPGDTPQNADTASTDTSPEDAPPTDTSDSVQEDTSMVDAELPPFADDDFCHEVEEFGAVFDDAIQTWARQDDRSPPVPGGLVIVGSSTVRRWEGFAQAYSDHAPIQRGFGGAQLGEVALFAETLVVRHNPRAVVVFAGTNDVAAGVSAPVVVERFRCLRQRIGRGLGWDRPVLFVGITPTPARWESWSVAMEVNRGIKALEAVDGALHYVDMPAAFLATGAPPDSTLFVDDALHLSAEGYALWDSVLRPAVDAVLEPLAPVDEPPEGSPPMGARVLIDVGPNNPGDGEVTPSPDYLGQHWNNWHDLDGGGQVLPGEHLDALRTTDGTPTPIGLVVTGGFEANGWANGGLRWPDQTLLGDLAVGSATGDFWYASGADQPGGWMFQGLDPGRRYTLRLFASRDDAELRITRFTAVGAGQSQSAVVQTSGVGAGQMDATTANNDDVAVLETLQADRWGHLFVDVEVVQGRYAYTSLIELHVQ